MENNYRLFGTPRAKATGVKNQARLERKLQYGLVYVDSVMDHLKKFDTPKEAQARKDVRKELAMAIAQLNRADKEFTQTGAVDVELKRRMRGVLGRLINELKDALRLSKSGNRMVLENVLLGVRRHLAGLIGNSDFWRGNR